MTHKDRKTSPYAQIKEVFSFLTLDIKGSDVEWKRSDWLTCKITLFSLSCTLVWFPEYRRWYFLEFMLSRKFFCAIFIKSGKVFYQWGFKVFNSEIFLLNSFGLLGSIHDVISKFFFYFKLHSRRNVLRLVERKPHQKKNYLDFLELENQHRKTFRSHNSSGQIK